MITTTTTTTTTRALREHELHQSPQNLIRDSNTDFRINPDPDVCRIAPKMYWIHSLVGLSHLRDRIATKS